MFKKIPELMTDPKLERNGIRVDVEVTQRDANGVELEPIRGWVLVRRAGGNNLLFDTVATALRKPFKYQLEHDMMAPEKKEELRLNIISDACLADFGGFPGEDGEPIPYSLANGRALMTEYSVVQDIVIKTAGDAGNYRLAEHNIAVTQAKNG